MSSDAKEREIADDSKGSNSKVATEKKSPGAPTAARRNPAAGAKFAQGFSQVIAVLMRDATFKNLRVGDLEWLVLPPMLAGQFALAHAGTEKNGPMVPVALALWARVSASVDKRLSGSLDKALVLRPTEWTSGNTIWIVALAGDQRALPKFLKHLQESEFKDRQVKMRVRDKDGKVTVRAFANRAKA